MKTRDVVKGASMFLSVLMPQLAPVFGRVPELVDLARDAFTQIGGSDADFDKILAANQKDIDRLADPDSFRHKPKAP